MIAKVKRIMMKIIKALIMLFIIIITFFAVYGIITFIKTNNKKVAAIIEKKQHTKKKYYMTNNKHSISNNGKYTTLKKKYEILKFLNEQNLRRVKATNKTIDKYLKEHKYKVIHHILKEENKAIDRRMKFKIIPNQWGE